MTTDLHLKQFSLRKIKAGHVICIIGRRGTGKTTLVEDLLHAKRKIPTATLFGGRYDLGKHFPSTFVLDRYEPEVVRSIIARSKKTLEPTLVVFDDCMYAKGSFHRDDNFREILMNGRHYNITLIITMQYCMDLHPSLRSQFDFVFAFKDNIRQNLESLWRAFFGIVDTLQNFRTIMQNCTENRHCMVIDNTSLSNNIEDVLFFYRASLHGDFKVGCRAYWYFHQIRGRAVDRYGAPIDNETKEQKQRRMKTVTIR